MRRITSCGGRIADRRKTIARGVRILAQVVLP
jgi:hypothetical protein